MAKTEVILIQNIVGLGGESDQVKVASGYARNYLFPQGLAVPLTGANKRRIEALRQRRGEREAHEFNTMSELSKSISKLITVVTVKTGEDGKMFGAVTAGTIADQLKTQFDITLEKKKIHLDHPLKTLGEHEIELRLHPEVTATLKVRVESSTPTAVSAQGPDQAEPGQTAPRTESRGHKRAGRAQEEAAAPVETEKAPDKKSREGRPAKGGKVEKSEKADKPEKSSKSDKSK